jgi:hypothetical protein
MAEKRIGLAAAATGGFIYGIGGSPTTSPSSPLASVERYDPIADTWVAVAPMPTARSGLAAGAVNGIIYAVGGVAVNGGAATAVRRWRPTIPPPTRGHRRRPCRRPALVWWSA